MKNKLIIGVLYTILLGLFVTSVSADGSEDNDEQVCTTSYGGGVVCGEQVPEEEVLVDTGLAENLMFAGLLFALGVIVKLASGRLAKAE